MHPLALQSISQNRIQAKDFHDTVRYTRVARAANLDLGSSYYTVTWETEVNDDDGCWASGAPTRLTVPSGIGITQARLIAYVAFENNASGTRGLKIVKNGSTTICTKEQAARNETGICIDTGLLTVAEGDYFELQAYSGSSSYDLLGSATWGGPAWFEIVFEHFKNNSRPKIRVSLLSSFDAAAAWNDISWSTVLQDDNNGECWTSSSPTLLTIPAGYTKARFRAFVSRVYSGTSGGANVQIFKTSGNPIALDIHLSSVSNNYYVDTGWIAVTPGDTYKTGIYSDSGYDVAGMVSPYGPSWFEVELAR